MRRTSDCCRRGPDRAGRGFTLLELLLVLVLIGLATTLVAPNLAGRLRQAEERAWIERVEDLLAGLPARARVAQQPSDWSAERLRDQLDAPPQELQLLLSEPLHYDARGLAQGGRVALSMGSRSLAAWRVEAHLGGVRRSDEARNAP